MARKPMTKSGLCAHAASEESHSWCRTVPCTCECHKTHIPYGGRGILYVVMSDREKLKEGQKSTIDVIADAIDEAIDNGYEDSEAIARYLTTSAFKHIKDRGIRYNSIIQASDATGAHIVARLFSAYNDLMKIWEDEGKTDDILRAQADGFACALSIVFHPFDTEHKDDPSVSDWDKVDKWAESLFVSQESARKVERYMEKERKKRKRQ